MSRVALKRAECVRAGDGGAHVHRRRSGSAISICRCSFARVLQAKLTVSHPQDVYEQEADRVADHVMRMPDSAASIVAQSTTRVQRRCDCDEELPLHVRKRRRPMSRPLTRGDRARFILSRLAGARCPESVRSFMEPRFNANFGGVRVHNDSHAHELARSVNAGVRKSGKTSSLAQATTRRTRRAASDCWPMS